MLREIIIENGLYAILFLLCPCLANVFDIGSRVWIWRWIWERMCWQHIVDVVQGHVHFVMRTLG